MRTILDQPLDLRSLQSLEAWSAPHIDSKINDPATPRYYLWIAQHGYREIDHEMGIFSYKRSRENIENSTFSLRIDLKRAGIAYHQHHIEADITCERDLFSTPLDWELKSAFSNTSDQRMPLYTLNKKGAYKNGIINETVSGRNRQYHVKGDWLSDYTLPASFQGALLKASDSVPFHYFQEFSLLKKSQTLRYAGRERISLNGETVGLLYFQHFGAGNLPYEYWITESGVLLFAVNAFNIWMLHDAPEAHYQNHLNRLNNR